MIEMVNEAKFDNDNFKQHISMDIMFEQEIQELIDAQYKSDRYIKTCEGMIKSYNNKIEKAKEKIEKMQDVIKHNIFNFLQEGIKTGVIPKTNIKENDISYIYTIPSARFILTKEKPYIVDSNILKDWLEKNHPDLIDESIDIEKLRQKLEIINDQIVMKDTGEIVPGLGLTETQFIIQYF